MNRAGSNSLAHICFSIVTILFHVLESYEGIKVRSIALFTDPRDRNVKRSHKARVIVIKLDNGEQDGLEKNERKEEESSDWLPLAFLIYIQIYTIRALEKCLGWVNTIRGCLGFSHSRSVNCHIEVSAPEQIWKSRKESRNVLFQECSVHKLH